jgi:hypothetical protein
MVRNRGFAVFQDGVYYLHGSGGNEIWLHEFATGRSHIVSAIEGRLGQYLSISPERKTFLFTLSVSAGSALMLIENFR